MIGAIIMGVLGIVFVAVGYILWKKEKISLLHEYHYHNVSEEDQKAFCAFSGWGVITIGIGILLTAFVMGITNSVWSFLVFAIGFAVGLALLLYAGNRYNH